jgi:hypothetical protein
MSFSLALVEILQLPETDSQSSYFVHILSFLQGSKNSNDFSTKSNAN